MSTGVETISGGVLSPGVGHRDSIDELDASSDVVERSVAEATVTPGSSGIYRSDDTGATWAKVSDPAMDALLISQVTVNVVPEPSAYITWALLGICISGVTWWRARKHLR